MTPGVFTIPPSVPFLPTLIGALSDGRLSPGIASGHLPFANMTLFLPTRRACRLARDAFLDRPGVDAALLPRIVPIGDIDEDELAFIDTAAGGGALDALTIPRPLAGTERRFLLARLIRKWAERLTPAAGNSPLVATHATAALGLADDLARLMDDMTTREVSWQKLDGLVPGDLDVYWQQTLRFLLIARERWPEILAERGAIEPAERRDRLIAAEADRIASMPDKFVVAAGSTGSMPATAKLLATIARVPHGAVVLPGLDMELDEESWSSIGGGTARGGAAVPPVPGHPQFAMQALLARIGISRSDVTVLGAPLGAGREIVASEALRPAATTDRWRTRLAGPQFTTAVTAAFAGITVIRAAGAEDEALAIAVALREILCKPDRIAALVTPDRALARRVAVALRRWNITADNSFGQPLAETSAGTFARLVAEAAIGRLAPTPLLALLKHPLARFGADPMRHRGAVAVLEQAILRGPRPRPGPDGLAHALAHFRAALAALKRGEASDLHRSDPRAALQEVELDAAERLLHRVTGALEPLESAASLALHEFAELAARHRDAVLRASTDAAGLVLAGSDGTALAAAFDDIATGVGNEPFPVAHADYPELFAVAIDQHVVRKPDPPGNRIRIYGPLEARLTGIDRVVIGGLVEGVWPPDPRTDPWLSRPMRHDLRLDLPERRIGLAAHDFAQLLGAPEVFLTYPGKLAGTPTVPSRFIQRLAAVSGPALWEAAIARGERYRMLGRSLDEPAAPPRPVARPAPRPPRAARPNSLSVTEIEHWLRDPYTIYAKHILKLPRLDPVDEPPGAAERGSLIHAAIGDFVQLYPTELPGDPCAELLRIGRKHFAPLDDFPQARAFWWPRFARIAAWFAGFEQARRRRIARSHIEVGGALMIPTPTGSFRLTGRADRIERLIDGGYAILDFKTGTIPSDKQVRIGVAPQLTLEAAMLRHGAFREIAPGGSVAELVYVALKGGEPAGSERIVKLEGRSPDDAAAEAYEKLRALVARFDDEATPYSPLVLSMWAQRYGTYDDLARVKEWSPAGGLVGDEE